MNNVIKYDDFTNLYSLQKTLRFKLKPIGKTQEHIIIKGIIDNDEELNRKAEIVKDVIDRYHRHHINEALSLATLKNNIKDLKRFEELYLKKNKEKKERQEYEEIQNKLRKLIVSFLEGNVKSDVRFTRIKERYNHLFDAKLFDDNEFINFAETKEEREALKAFDNFKTYFVGFHENRKNVYTDEAIPTAVAYRIIHENLPRFIENAVKFKKIIQSIDQKELSNIKNNLKYELGKTKLEDVFTLEYFENTLTQEGITRYNTILGGKSDQDGKKIQGINEVVNLFNQKNTENNLPFLKPLYKQILGKEQTFSFVTSNFKNDDEVLQAISDFWNNNIIKAKDSLTGKVFNVLNEARSFCNEIGQIKEPKYTTMFIDKKNINKISHNVYGQWNIIRDALAMYNDILLNGTDEADIENNLNKDVYSWKEIKEALHTYKSNTEDSDDIDEKAFIEYFAKMEAKEELDDKIITFDIIDNIKDRYKDVEPLLKENRKGKSNLHQEKDKVALIKLFLDSLKTLQMHLKLLNVEEDVEGKNYEVYNKLDLLVETLYPLNELYNKVRNYMTRKPYSEEKFKLNFNKPTLLDGWDVSKERDNLGVIFRKQNMYYLGILDRDHNNILDDAPQTKSDNYYEKMFYKLLPGPNKMLPKVFFSEKGLKNYNPPKQILDLYRKGEFKKGESFNKKSLHLLIDFYKDAISKNKDWDVFNFQFKQTNEYEDINEFYRDIEEQGYNISFKKIDAGYINKLVEEGKLYLFQIYNKDFSEYSKGKPNLHTIYWKEIFSDINLKSKIYKLNGEAEVFFRRKSIEYPEEIIKKGHHYDELKNKFSYPIIKDRRYAENTFLFHVLITINFISKRQEKINPLVKDYIATTKEDIHIIGIDRGERNLLYLTLINSKGEIINQLSLNTLSVHTKNDEIILDYHSKLIEKEKERNKARQNWDVIQNIKELKEGYLSQVVHQIVKLMVEHKAILVMEDLNIGFKRGRFKFERQVYQKFEKMLIEKLNYCVFKEQQPEKPGGSLNAYQLTEKFRSFKEMGKQNGMIFYVPAIYTSKIDPTTGFYNFLKVDMTTISKAKDFINNFDKIMYNKKEDYFEFHCTYGKFVKENKELKSTRAKEAYNELKNKKWIICTTHHKRYKVIKNIMGYVEYKEIEVNNELKQIFNECNIDYTNIGDIRESLLKLENAKVFKRIGDVLKVLLAMRYNNGKKRNDEEDYIVSPVKNKSGKFYCTLDAVPKLPLDADANGAYNIALKGLLLIDRIRQAGKDGIKDLSISNIEWIYFLAKRAGI